MVLRRVVLGRGDRDSALWQHLVDEVQDQATATWTVVGLSVVVLVLALVVFVVALCFLVWAHLRL